MSADPLCAADLPTKNLSPLDGLEAAERWAKTAVAVVRRNHRQSLSLSSGGTLIVLAVEIFDDLDQIELGLVHQFLDILEPSVRTANSPVLLRRHTRHHV